MAEFSRDRTKSSPCQLTRRRLLGFSTAVIATGISGCINRPAGGDPETTGTPVRTTTSQPTPPPTHSESQTHEQVPSELQTETNGSATTISGDIVLEEGQFSQHELRFDKRTRIMVDGVMEGDGGLDILLFSSEREFAKYQSGEGEISSEDYIASNVESIDRTLEVPSGRYFLTFDNSGVYGAQPTGTVQLELQVVTQAITEDSDPDNYSPSQPKILEVTDNLGHTFKFSGDDPPSKDARTDDEVIVSDETEIELCVTEVAKNEGDNVTYSFDFLNVADHPDNPGKPSQRFEEACWAWNLRRNDYQSQWGFRIWVRNGDEIYYQNQSVESDFSVDIYYTKLVLEE